MKAITAKDLNKMLTRAGSPMRFACKYQGQFHFHNRYTGGDEVAFKTVKAAQLFFKV